MEPLIGDKILYVMPGGVKLVGLVTYVWPNGVINCVVFGDGVNERDASRLRMSVDRDDSGERINTWSFVKNDEIRFEQAMKATLETIRIQVDAAPTAQQTFAVR